MAGDLTLGFSRSRVVSAKASTAQVDVTSSTTLTTITGLTHKVQGNTIYKFSGHITATSGSAGGCKVAVAGDGNLTTAMFTCTAMNFNGTTLNAQTTTTTLGNAVGAATAVVTDIYITGAISVTKPGTVSVQIAQNVSNGTATSALVGSNFEFVPVH